MTLEGLSDEALSQPFEGWDFTWLRNRAPITRTLPWSYSEVVSQAAGTAERMLDMGTGGGEALLQIPRRGAITIADEAFAPNVPIAAANLRPHGIPVVQVEGAPDNDCQDGIRGRLPYANRSFDCVANRTNRSWRARCSESSNPGAASSPSRSISTGTTTSTPRSA